MHPPGIGSDVAVLIPARRASTRLPEKLLLAEHGEALIVTAAKRAALAFGDASVVVCADDAELIAVVRAQGLRAEMTLPTHASGTDRIAEIAATLNAEIIVNVQGDEPEMEAAHIRLVAELLRRHPWAGMATLCVPGDAATQANPNQVKVILADGENADEGRALWFTRLPAVYDRDAGRAAIHCHRHLGIYAYRRQVLLDFAALPPAPLEACEKLEQLRALAAGIGIACASVDHAAIGIDTRADYDAFLTQRTRLSTP